MIHLKHCTVQFEEWGCRTVFKDKTFANAIPHESPHYAVIAHRLGYGDDTMAYCQEHELAHSLVAEYFRDQPSHVLWHVAHGTSPSMYEVVAEEVMAQMLQRWYRANERPIVSGVDWDAIKRHMSKALEATR